MTTRRLSVPLDAATDAAVRAAAPAGEIGQYVASIVREHMLKRAAAAASDMDREDRNPEWEAVRMAGRA